MEKAPTPSNEEERLQELKNYNVLDTATEEEFDDITCLASYICKVPIALVSLVDQSRQWFKSRVGLEAHETPRDVSFCGHAIMGQETFVVKDSHLDGRFSDNPLVTGPAQVRFYAGVPLTTPRGHSIGTLCVIDHAPRHLEEEQLKALEALGRKVVSLLELRLQNERAKQALKTKALFLANMSHEIRTPLNGILGCTNLLLDNIKKPENVQLLETVVSSGESLLTLINDILDFSKLEFEKMELEDEPFELRSAMNQVIQLFNSKASEKSICLSWGLDEKLPPWIYGDVTRLRQILSNLVSNAIKFTKKGKIEVRADLLAAQGDEYKIQFSVKDEGIGMDKEATHRLFQSFSQVDASTTKKFGGTGLGLAICKALTEMMGGEVWVESEEGKGSCFYFSLLARKAEERLSQKRNSQESLFESDMALSHPLKILLADDNRVNQLVASKFLKKLGYRIDVVADGEEALGMLHKRPYDLIFMDCHMPHMDGFEATQRILEEYGENRPRIVALTASAMKEDRDLCFQQGMDDFISKPVEMRELVRALRACPPNPQLKRNQEEGEELEEQEEWEEQDGGTEDQRDQRNQRDQAEWKEKEETQSGVKAQGMGKTQRAQRESQGMEKSQGPLVDKTALLEHFDGDRDLLSEVVGEFHLKSKECLREMEQAIKALDSEKLERVAHYLKGMCSNFKVERVIHHSFQLEQLARDLSWEGVHELFHGLKEDMGVMGQELEKISSQEVKAA